MFSENELTRHIYLLSAILRIMDSNADIITHSDLLYLTETIEKATQLNKIDVPTEVFISMIRSCLELVSRLIDPDMAKLWEDLRDRWVCCGIEIGYTLLFWNQIQKVDGNSYVRFMSLFPVLSQNYLGPLTMVENIDKLLWTLADELWAERKSFTMSTKNMGTVFFASFSMTR